MSQSEMPRPLLFILSLVLTVSFGACWHLAGIPTGNHDKSRSILRSLFETIAFTSVATASYCVWFFLPTQTLGANIFIYIACTIPHMVFSYFVIDLEYKGKGTKIYGLLYFASFLLGSTATSALFNIYITYVTTLWVHNIVAVFTFVTTVCFAPEFYRTIIDNGVKGTKDRPNKPNKWDVFKSTLSYFSLFISFVVYTGLFNILFVG